MGVDYYMVCLDCLERMYVGSNITYIELLEEIIKNRWTLEDILEGCNQIVRDFVKEQIDRSAVAKVVRFVERHRDCKELYLWNDMMDIEGSGYIPEVEWNRKPNRKRNIERMKQDILENAPLILFEDKIVRGIRFDFEVPKEIEELEKWSTKVVRVVEAKYIVECDDGKYYDCTQGECVEVDYEPYEKDIFG